MSKKTRDIFFSIMMLLVFCIGHLFRNALVFEGNEGTVKPESNVTYYINVTYDGKDKETGAAGGAQTNASDVTDDTASKSVDIFSGRINVADKIPEGMEFVGFVENDGGIGATLKDGTPCSGYIVNGTNGLQYTESDRTVRFTVNELQAGGKLTVGVIVRTPSVEPNQRKDFYNYILGEGADNIALHKVTYEYTG